MFMEVNMYVGECVVIVVQPESAQLNMHCRPPWLLFFLLGISGCRIMMFVKYQ